MPFKKGEGRPPFNISESEIRYAMANTKSCGAASRFLKVSYVVFKKYASMYIDRESGKTLFELHKNLRGIGIKRASRPRLRGQYGIYDILEGKYPKYDHRRLKVRLLKNSIFEEKCDSCDYDQRRITDYTVPLLLDWIDGDKTNHKRENLRFLCYNCYYLEVGNMLGGRIRSGNKYI
ncbi:MAG: hypothetical protein H8E55_21250 [Pelagibacterales bacterium]|nr:hypothetical protein [Pelagibacterales bacterium]